MKLVNHTERVVVPRGLTGYTLHMSVVFDCGVNSSLVGYQCDAIMLNLVDLARLQLMMPNELQEWLRETQARLRIQFDPRIVK
jgi:hypothetical protein